MLEVATIFKWKIKTTPPAHFNDGEVDVFWFCGEGGVPISLFILSQIANLDSLNEKLRTLIMGGGPITCLSKVVGQFRIKVYILSFHKNFDASRNVANRRS